MIDVQSDDYSDDFQQDMCNSLKKSYTQFLFVLYYHQTSEKVSKALVF
jgi:hypothetical protein